MCADQRQWTHKARQPPLLTSLVSALSSSVSDMYLKVFLTRIKMILVYLERPGCLVSRTLKKLEI